MNFIYVFIICVYVQGFKSREALAAYFAGEWSQLVGLCV